MEITTYIYARHHEIRLMENHHRSIRQKEKPNLNGSPAFCGYDTRMNVCAEMFSIIAVCVFDAHVHMSSRNTFRNYTNDYSNRVHIETITFYTHTMCRESNELRHKKRNDSRAAYRR